MTMHGGVGRVPAAPLAAGFAASVNSGLRTGLITQSQMSLLKHPFRVVTMNVHPQRHTCVATVCAQRRTAGLESGMGKRLRRGADRVRACRPNTVIALRLANDVARDVVLPQHKCEVRPVTKRIAKRTHKRIAMNVSARGEALISGRLKAGVTAPTTTRTRRRVPQYVASGGTERNDMTVPMGQARHSPNTLDVSPVRNPSEALERNAPTRMASTVAMSVGTHILTGLDKCAAKRGNSSITKPVDTPIVR